MELMHDWKGFQSVFNSRAKSHLTSENLIEGPIYLITEGDKIISASSEGEDLTSWVGTSCEEKIRQKNHREFFCFERKQVDQWIHESVVRPHLYDQIELLRTKAINNQNKKLLFNKHFLLDALQGWWGKILPSSYGIYLQLSDQTTGNFLIVIQHGSLTGYHEPDLSSLSPERKKDSAEVVRYLSEKYLVPIQGILISGREWGELVKFENPWREVAQGLRENRFQLVPFRWSLATLIATRAFFGV